MGRRRKTYFDESLIDNELAYNQYLSRLMELSITMFDWKNVPDEIDIRFLEMILFLEGKVVFFKDEDLDKYLALQCVINGKLNVYRIPTQRRAIAINGYNKNLDENDSVIIYNNYLHGNSTLIVRNMAKRLYNLDRIIDVNCNAQKTPVIVQGNEQQRLTLKNLYKEYDGNAPVIFCDKNIDMNSLKVLSTEAPFVSQELYQLKTQYWNEALTYLGITNVNYMKKERLISDEVARQNGGTIASRYSRLEARRDACKQINKMFGLNMDVDYREDYREMDDDIMLTGQTGDGSYDTVMTDLRTRTHVQ